MLVHNEIKVKAQINDEYRIRNTLELTAGRDPLLHIVCMYNRVEIVKLLLKHPNIDANILNWDGKTPIYLTDNCEYIINRGSFSAQTFIFGLNLRFLLVNIFKC